MSSSSSSSLVQDVRDQIDVLLRQEDTIYRCTDYMAHERPEGMMDIGNTIVEECANLVTDLVKSQSAVSISDVKDVDQHHKQYDQTYTFWRQQMFDWACLVVDSFGMDREVVAVSFNLLDRYIAIESSKPGSPPITRDDYQLFSMTCLYVAIKILEPIPRKLSVQTLVDMSKNYYSKEIIESTEMEILQALKWRLHAPTGIRYARLFKQLFPAGKTISFHMEAEIETLTEIAVSDSFFVACRPSIVGLAAVIHAARLEGMSDSSIQHVQANLQGLISTRDNEEFRTVYLQLEKLHYH